ncbi:MAG: hypothetical protein CR986_03790 [Ignavibacteriae bacterium]|nr:MAG: hypothetical protein CR986_03790 [Ignavibacteriota bacterium]
MLKTLDGAKLGIFVFLGTVLLVLAIFMLGNKNSLFSDNIYIKTYFDNVEGLRTGAPVRLNGLSVGSVSDIKLTEINQYKVEVTLRIKKDVQEFIRLDSEAAIETEGIIGSKIVIITPGSEENAAIKDGGVILSQKAFNMGRVMAETQEIMVYMKNLSKELAEVLLKVNNGEGTIGKLINDESLYFESVKIVQSADTALNVMVNRLDRMGAFILELGNNIESIIVNVDSAALDLHNLITNVKQGKGALGTLIGDKNVSDSIKAVIKNLTATTQSAKIGAESFSENMEALKHNWLFKNYFEERGYWDRAEYENEINKKLEKIEKSKKELDEKIKELEELEKSLTD